MDAGEGKRTSKRKKTSLGSSNNESDRNSIGLKSSNKDIGSLNDDSTPCHSTVSDENVCFAYDSENEFQQDQKSDNNNRVRNISLSQVKTEKCEVNKRRKIHLSYLDCRELSNTSSGAKALSKPFEVPKSNKDPNRHLHPRTLRKSPRRGAHSCRSSHVNDNQGIHESEIKESWDSNCPEIVSVNGNLFQNVPNESDHTAPSFAFKGSGFTRASSLLSLQEKTANKVTDYSFSHHSSVGNESTRGCDPSSSFTSASSLLGLTESQIEVGGFTSKKTASEKLFQRTNTKIQRAKDKAGPFQKSISNFFTQSTKQSTSPRKLTMEQKETTSNSLPEMYKSPSKMYSPIKQFSQCIYISDSSPNSSQGSSQESKRKSNLEDNVAVKKLFEGQKSLASGQSLPKKRKQGSSQPTATQTSRSFNFATQVKEEPSQRDVKQKIYKDTYGLVGEGSSSSFDESCTINYFEILPLDIIELIFSQLPILDLCLNSNRVCLQWNEIISDQRFVPWKKKYHKLKAAQPDIVKEILDTMAKSDMTLPSKFLKGLIRFMKDFKPVTALNMTSCLSSHPKYEWATALIKERVPECVDNGEANPWSVMTTLVVISDSVVDVQKILTCLSVSQSQCTSMEVMECLYCIASFLYVFRLKAGADVWSGMHYRVFYALYLYENSSVSNHGMLQDAMSSNASGQQTIVKYSQSGTSVRLTHEQIRIIKHTPNHGDTIKIIAFAGTGKTTTLVRYTQMRPDKKFLLVVYNKSVQEHAQTQFPKNVTCKTGHALAFAKKGRMYITAKKLRNLKVYEISQVLPARKGHNLYIQSKFVMETINNFCSSADDNITSAHVPDSRLDEASGLKVAIDHDTKMVYAKDAEYLWKRMEDFEDKRVGMTHDGYLKLYQLSRPQLYQYDMILIDEAQDLTPAVIDILIHQEQAKILVGDPHQQIYSFRGAVNAMRQIPSSHTFYLTQSFRFGPEIAHVAASCLELFKNVRDKTLVGHGTPGHVRGEKVGQVAMISRLNFTVFSEAVKKCCYASENYKVAFVGGTDAFGFPMIRDIYSLMLSEEDRKKDKHVIENKLISKFQNLAELEKYATKVMDVELLGKIRIVKTFHNGIPLFLSKIQSKCVRDSTQADYVFSTAHKAKGLEFSTVQVSDDFVQVQGVDVTAIGFQRLNQMSQIPADEANLLYVAVTRAKHALLLSPTLLRVLKDNGERFEYPVSRQLLERDTVPFKCLETDAVFTPYTLTLRKLDIKLGDIDVRKGGLFSPVFLSEDFHRFAELLGDPSVKPKPKQARGARPRIIVNFRFDPNAQSDDEDDDAYAYGYGYVGYSDEDSDGDIPDLL